jgi:HK97 family phage major capsid protein
MNMISKEAFQKERDAYVAQGESILAQATAQNRDLTEIDRANFETSVAKAEAAAVKAAQAEQMEQALPGIIARKTNADIDAVPAKVKTASTTLFRSVKDAYDSGQWLRARFLGSDDATAYCQRNGLIRNAMSTPNNPAGGFLVPDPLENAIIELREQYGMFRQNSQNITMGNGKILLPKVTGEVTAYYVGEGVNITPSDMSVTQVQLDAKKIATLTVMSSELSEDSVVSVAEMLARSIAYQFAVAEDQAGFNGDGTSTYGGILGLSGALAAGSKVTATGDQTFADLILGNFEEVVGKCKRFGGSQKWYISRAGWAASMQRLANAALGATAQDLTGGVEPRFLGFPVVWSEVLESALTGTTGKVACYFGDLQTGTYLGTRRGVSIALDSSRYFESDQLALRATQRFDIVVHDRGDANTSGGIVALIFG